MARHAPPDTKLHRYVDMWAFMGVHPTNIEILQRLKMADDRQFGANMDVCGTVAEEDQTTGEWSEIHVVGIRTDAWNPTPEKLARKCEILKEERQEELRRQIRRTGRLNQQQQALLAEICRVDPVLRMCPQDLECRRLVLKLFKSTTDRIRWQGSLEEVTTREVHNSLGSNGPLISFASSLDNYEYLTAFQENRRRWRIPSIFSFCYYEMDRDRIWYVELRRKWVSFGIDFRIIADGRQVGEIDGALFGFGYNAHIHVTEPDLANDRQFADLLTLFTASVGYHKAIRRSIQQRVKASRRGLPAVHIVEPEEFRLLKNPRAA
ncbi:MAG: hypothetical protein KDA80_10715 [Planctomycetaceae bacterium]|nr:hypothetical protein [Planctomycetaceae bacterium]